MATRKQVQEVLETILIDLWVENSEDVAQQMVDALDEELGLFEDSDDDVEE